MKNKTHIQIKPAKTFTWCISSAKDNFKHSIELQSARDGSDTSGCGSGISPLRPALYKLREASPLTCKKTVY